MVPPGTVTRVALDPGLAAILQLVDAMGLGELATGTPEEGRRGFRAMTCDIRVPELVIPVGDVEDGSLPGPVGPIPYRVYRPAAPAGASRPTILFIHGGGWVIGDLDTHDNQARRLCRDVDAVVMSIDYRLAPEAPFPAAVEDCWAALNWAGRHIDQLGGDAARFAVAGDSAGGNLSAVMAQLARDKGGPTLAAQLLIYPAIVFHTDYPSRTENARGYLLTLADMQWFADHYVGSLGDGIDLADPRLSPITADLAGLAPAVVVTAEFDPLRDEGEAYARALEDAGTPVTLVRFDGMIHGYFDLGPVSPAVEAAAARTCALLKDLLHSGPR